MSSNDKKDEQQFTIQPHPATTNDPKTDPALTGSNPGSVAGGRQPYVPSADIASTLEKPKTREELQAAQASLNK